MPCSNDLLEDQEIINISRLLSEMHTFLNGFSTVPKRWTLDDRLFLDRSIEILEDCNKFNPNIELAFLKDVVKELKEQIQATPKAGIGGFVMGISTQVTSTRETMGFEHL